MRSNLEISSQQQISPSGDQGSISQETIIESDKSNVGRIVQPPSKVADNPSRLNSDAISDNREPSQITTEGKAASLKPLGQANDAKWEGHSLSALANHTFLLYNKGDNNSRMTVSTFCGLKQADIARGCFDVRQLWTLRAGTEENSQFFRIENYAHPGYWLMANDALLSSNNGVILGRSQQPPERDNAQWQLEKQENESFIIRNKKHQEQGITKSGKKNLQLGNIIPVPENIDSAVPRPDQKTMQWELIPLFTAIREEHTLLNYDLRQGSVGMVSHANCYRDLYCVSPTIFKLEDSSSFAESLKIALEDMEEGGAFQKDLEQCFSPDQHRIDRELLNTDPFTVPAASEYKVLQSAVRFQGPFGNYVLKSSKIYSETTSKDGSVKSEPIEIK